MYKFVSGKLRRVLEVDGGDGCTGEGCTALCGQTVHSEVVKTGIFMLMCILPPFRKMET